MMNMFNSNGGINPSLAKVLRSNGIIFNDIFINEENYVMDADVKRAVYVTFGNAELLNSMDIDEEREEKNCDIKVEYGQVNDTKIFERPLPVAIKRTRKSVKDKSPSENAETPIGIDEEKEEKNCDIKVEHKEAANTRISEKDLVAAIKYLSKLESRINNLKLLKPYYQNLPHMQESVKDKSPSENSEVPTDITGIKKENIDGKEAEKQIFNVNNQLDVVLRGRTKRRTTIVAEQNIKQLFKKSNKEEEEVYDENVENFLGSGVETDQLSDVNNQNNDALQNKSRSCLLTKKRKKFDVFKAITLDEKRRLKKDLEWRRKDAVANLTIKELLLSKYIPSKYNPSKRHKVSEQMIAFKLVQLEERSDTSIQEFKYVLGIDGGNKKLEYKPYEKFKSKAIVPFLTIAKNEYNEGNIKSEITEAIKFFNRKKDSIENSEAKRAIERANDFLGAKKFTELPKINLKGSKKSNRIPKGNENLPEKERD